MRTCLNRDGSVESARRLAFSREIRAQYKMHSSKPSLRTSCVQKCLKYNANSMIHIEFYMLISTVSGRLFI